MSKDVVSRDSEGRIIGHPSNADDPTRFEVLLERYSGRMDRIESNQGDMAVEQKEMHSKIDNMDKNISTMVQYYRETLNKQNEMQDEICKTPDGLKCRISNAERGLSAIFGGIKTAAWIIGILIAFSGAAFAAIKLLGG